MELCVKIKQHLEQLEKKKNPNENFLKIAKGEVPCRNIIFCSINGNVNDISFITRPIQPTTSAFHIQFMVEITIILTAFDRQFLEIPIIPF